MPQAAEPLSDTLQNARILIVDDEPANVLLLERLLLWRRGGKVTRPFPS